MKELNFIAKHGRHQDVEVQGLCSNLWLYNHQGRKPKKEEIWNAVEAFLKERLLPVEKPSYEFACALWKDIIFSIEDILIAYDRAVYEKANAEAKLAWAERKLTERPEELMRAMQEFVAAAQGKQEAQG